MPLAAAAVLLLQIVSAPPTISGSVLDPSGASVAGARIEVVGSSVVATTALDGGFTAPATVPVTIVVTAPGFADQRVQITSSSPVHIVLEPRGITAALTVSASADRARVSTPAAVTVLDRATLESSPALSLDDQLRTVPGFSLFRRSSSRVANPTTQGVTLRGLAASGASRATVVADGVSLSDPFGGWVYRDRVPAAAIERVEVARGGASDIFGSDALGGAIRIDTSVSGARVIAEGGDDGTARLSGFAGWKNQSYNVRGGAEQFTTDGFIVVAPESRGPIDVPAWSTHTSLFAAASTPVAGTTRVDVRGGYLSEDRGNGTPFQANDTAGGDVSVRFTGAAFGGFWTTRGVFTSQDYDQTFSAVNATRTAESPTSTQHVSSTSGSIALEWVRPVGGWTLVAAASGREVDADLSEELPPSLSAAPSRPIAARQRNTAFSAQVSWPFSPRATFAAGARGELWSTRVKGGHADNDAGSFVPRVSFVFRATPSVSLRVSLENAYRVPTINELYRGFRVGNVQTLANVGLTPEQSYGGDASVLVTHGALVFRATGYFATVNDAIVNVTITPVQSALILRVRDNAGRIHAAGAEIESEVRLTRALTATASGTFGSSTFGGDGELAGLRVPQVPRVQIAAGLRGTWRRAAAGIDWRYTGKQFDDDRNQFVLRAAAITDARASWTVRRGIDLFVAVENIVDVDQDVGRTPLRTVGLPRSARIGIRIGVPLDP